MSINEFNTILVDRILSKTIGATIQVDSPISFNAGVVVPIISSPSIDVDTINPFTPGGDVTISTNLDLDAGKDINSDQINVDVINARNNAFISVIEDTTILPGKVLGSNLISPASGTNTELSGEILFSNVLGLKTNNIDTFSGGTITIQQDVTFPVAKILNVSNIFPGSGTLSLTGDLTLDAASSVETDTINSVSAGGIDFNDNILLTNRQLQYGATNTSSIYESGAVNFFTTSSGQIFAPFVQDYLSAAVTQNSNSRTCVANTDTYSMAAINTSVSSVVSSNIIVGTGGIDAFFVSCSGLSYARLITLTFSFSAMQNQALSNVVLYGIILNPVFGLDSEVLSGTVLPSAYQEVEYGSMTDERNTTCTYMGPVSPADIFYLTCHHPVNGAKITMAYCTITAITTSIGTD